MVQTCYSLQRETNFVTCFPKQWSDLLLKERICFLWSKFFHKVLYQFLIVSIFYWPLIILEVKISYCVSIYFINSPLVNTIALQECQSIFDKILAKSVFGSGLNSAESEISSRLQTNIVMYCNKHSLRYYSSTNLQLLKVSCKG